MATVIGRIARSRLAGRRQDDHDRFGTVGHRGQRVERQPGQTGQGPDLALLHRSSPLVCAHRASMAVVYQPAERKADSSILSRAPLL